MGHKSRVNWNLPICLRSCMNKGKKCKKCIGNSEFEPIYLSDCCGVSVETDSGIEDFIGDKPEDAVTMCYICSKCKKPCDIKTDGDENV